MSFNFDVHLVKHAGIAPIGFHRGSSLRLVLQDMSGRRREPASDHLKVGMRGAAVKPKPT
jgi:hypothetical protein